jgi:hypothetical protein
MPRNTGLMYHESSGGEGEIRTLDGPVTHNSFRGCRLAVQPITPEFGLRTASSVNVHGCSSVWLSAWLSRRLQWPASPVVSVSFVGRLPAQEEPQSTQMVQRVYASSQTRLFRIRIEYCRPTAALAIAAALSGLLSVAAFTFPLASSAAWLAFALVLLGLLQGRGSVFPAALIALFVVAQAEVVHGELNITTTPLVGALLLGSAEFGYWSFENETGLKHAVSATLRRLVVIVGLVLVGAGLSGTLALLLDPLL